MLHLKFDANEREELSKFTEWYEAVEFDYWVEGSLEQITRALVRLGLVDYV